MLAFIAALPQNNWCRLFQVTRHYSAHHSQKIKMTLEKLQLIATAAVEPEYKVRWLKWWNREVSIVKLSDFPKVLQVRTTWNLGSIKQHFGQGYVYPPCPYLPFNSSFCANSCLRLKLSTARGSFSQGVTRYTCCIGWPWRRRGSWFVAGVLGEVTNLPLG